MLDSFQIKSFWSYNFDPIILDNKIPKDLSGHIKLRPSLKANFGIYLFGHIQTPSSPVQCYYWIDEQLVVIPERWAQKDYGSSKLGPQRLAAHKDWLREMKKGEIVRLGMLIVPRKLGVPESALSGHVKITFPPRF